MTFNMSFGATMMLGIVGMRGLHPDLQGRRRHARPIGDKPEARRFGQRRLLLGDAVAGRAIGMRIFETGLRVAGLFSGDGGRGARQHKGGAERSKQQMLHREPPYSAPLPRSIRAQERDGELDAGQTSEVRRSPERSRRDIRRPGSRRRARRRSGLRAGSAPRGQAPSRRRSRSRSGAARPQRAGPARRS